MELERIELVRRVLAEKAMGWHEENWRDVPVWLDNKGKYKGDVRDWRPDVNPLQAINQVIEAMREKGWREVVRDAEYPLIRARWFHTSDIFEYWDAEGDSEPYARMLAAARALEATDA